MKTKLLAALLAVLLLLTACAAPTPESESTPPPEPESVSEPEPKDVSNYFMEGDVDGTEDQEAAENLYWYLKGDLTPKEYCYIQLNSRAKEHHSSDDTRLYFLYLQGTDRAPVETLLREYDGPWAPIWFEENNKTLYDLMQAEEYAKAFFYEHPDVILTAVEIEEGTVYVTLGEPVPHELTAYLNEYPVEYIFIARNGRQENPD